MLKYKYNCKCISICFAFIDTTYRYYNLYTGMYTDIPTTILKFTDAIDTFHFIGQYPTILLLFQFCKLMD